MNGKQVKWTLVYNRITGFALNVTDRLLTIVLWI